VFSISGDVGTYLLCNFINKKVKGKIHPQTDYEGLEGSEVINL